MHRYYWYILFYNKTHLDVCNSQVDLKSKEKIASTSAVQTRSQAVHFKPELLACAGAPAHITNVLSKCPFQDNSVSLFRPEWSLIWITADGPHLKVSHIRAGSNTRSTQRMGLIIIHCRVSGRAVMLKPQHLLWLPLTLLSVAVKSPSIIKMTPKNKTTSATLWARCTGAYTHLHLWRLGDTLM